MNPRAVFRETRLIVIAVLILIWTLVPIYHMFMLSVTPVKEAVGTALWPVNPTFDNYRTVFGEGHQFLRNFWIQLGNSVFTALTVSFLVLAISSAASFAVSRLKVWWGHAVINAALLTYLIPAAFLAIPMYKTMNNYGILDSRWALILSMVTFATPYAIWVLRNFADTVPAELDEAAKVDGASVPQMFRLIYIPLMMPALIAIGTYSLLLAWNEYLYALLMLSNPQKVTLPVTLGYFLLSDDAPWALLMATSMIYALPPAALYYAVRKYMVSGLTTGSVKG
jgi:multiple sugar transport system permease protein